MLYYFVFRICRALNMCNLQTYFYKKERLCTCHVMTNETTCQSKNCNAKIPDMKTSTTQEAKNWHIQTTKTNHNKIQKKTVWPFLHEYICILISR